MSTLSATFLVEIDGITAERDLLGKTLTVRQRDPFRYRIDIPSAEHQKWPVDKISNALTMVLDLPAGTDADERRYQPTLAFLNIGQGLVDIRIVRITVIKRSDIAAKPNEDASANQADAEAEFVSMRSFAVQAATQFCDAVRLHGQPWIEPSGIFPRVLNAPYLVDTESELAFPFRIGVTLDSIRIVDSTGILDAESFAAIETLIESRSLEVGARLIGEALYLAQSQQHTGASQATLLAAMGVEIHTKHVLRTIASPSQLPLLDLLLDSPRDWSLSAHALFDAALPAIVRRDLGPTHKNLIQPVTKLFSARNKVAHKGVVIDVQEARQHAQTAKDVLDYLDGLARERSGRPDDTTSG